MKYFQSKYLVEIYKKNKSNPIKKKNSLNPDIGMDESSN